MIFVELMGALSALVVSSVLGAIQAPVEPELRNLVLRDCILPSPAFAGDDEGFNFAMPQGDLGNDGYADFFLRGYVAPFFGSGRPNKDTFLLSEVPYDGPNAVQTIFGAFEWTRGYRERTASILASGPNERRIVGRSPLLSQPESLGVWDIQTGKLLMEIGFPNPPSGYPNISSFRELRSAGDVNSDGYHDLLFCGRTVSGNWWVTGVFDGFSGMLLWQDYQANYLGHQLWTETSDSSLPPDFDGDGFPDQITAYIDYGMVSHLIALSGVDGQELWRYSYDSNGILTTYRPGCANKDISGDGIPDVVSVSGYSPMDGEIACLDGSSGSLLWKLDWLEVVSATRARFGNGSNCSPDSPIWVTPALGNPAKNVVNLVVVTKDQFGASEVRRILRMNAESGEIVGFVELPSTLIPWLDESTRHLQFGSWSEQAFLLGDIDGDGFTEVGLSVLVPSLFGWSQSYAFAICGEPTLSGPSEASLGDNINLKVRIPSSPGESFSVIMSNVFDPDGGFVRSGWKTSLGASPLLSESLGNRVTGTLDGNGFASVILPLNSVNLTAGDTLMLRAIIESTSGSNPIKTLSSIHSLKIE